MKNQKALIPLCLLLCNGFALVVRADAPTDNTLQGAMADVPAQQQIQGVPSGPYERKIAAWMPLLQNTKTCLDVVSSLQQKVGNTTPAFIGLKSAQTRLEAVRDIAEQQIASLQQTQNDWVNIDTKLLTRRYAAATRAANTAVDQLQATRLLVGQFQADSLPASDSGTFTISLDATSSSAKAVLQLVTPKHRTPAERDAFSAEMKRKSEETARFLADYDDWAKKEEVLTAQQNKDIAETRSKITTMRKLMADTLEKVDAIKKKSNESSAGARVPKKTSLGASTRNRFALTYLAFNSSHRASISLCQGQVAPYNPDTPPRQRLVDAVNTATKAVNDATAAFTRVGLLTSVAGLTAQTEVR